MNPQSSTSDYDSHYDSRVVTPEPQADSESVAPAQPVIDVHNLRKVYRTGFWMNQKVVTLQNFSLKVFSGETFGLLGPNGAGKTTLLKSLLGIIRLTSGHGTLLEKPLGDRSVKHRIGYLPENPYFYDFLTGWEFLEYTAGLFQLSKHDTKKRISELLELVGLAYSAAQKKQLRQYSKGMLQRVGMAQALINDPEVVFLDEPMSGLDPMGRYQIREIILSLKEQGKTIFFNSHILSDVELICDRVGILAQGELIRLGSIQELLGAADVYHVVVKGGQEAVLKQWIPDLELRDGLWHGHLQGQPHDFMASLNLMNATIVSLKFARPTLEEFFVQQLRQRGIQVSS
ncbi:MAG: ABC transporter ATP-binding protein [Leptolyngbyaceae bacterium]|nr:ABC transporter ATP-binding protein [Leptolyngbyaceae bacterium]